MRKLPILAGVAVLTVAAAAPVMAQGPAAGRPMDRHFLEKAIKGDNSEIQLGQMAQRQGQSEGVRNFGQMLEADHREARRQAVEVARPMGMTPPDEMMPEARREADKLKVMNGRAFDREFARYMVKDHRKDISDFETEARRGHGPTADLARQTLPVLRKHLQVAERLVDRGR